MDVVTASQPTMGCRQGAMRRAEPCRAVLRGAGPLAARALLSCALLSGSAAAQAPWVGWYGPPGDGMYGALFGMDPASADQALQALGLRRASGRTNSLRYQGKLDGIAAELVCDFLPEGADPARGRLYRIAVMWTDIDGGTRKPLALFQLLDQRLRQRYDLPKHSRDATEGTLSTGAGFWMRLYQGPEMQAQLELRARGPERYYVRLVLDYPQLHPELARR